MKVSIKFLFVTFLSLLLFSACQKDTAFAEEEPIAVTETTKSYANTPTELWDYFQRFEEEALLRGERIDLNTRNLTAEIMEITEDGVAGTCSYSSHAPNHIVIDQSFFNQTSELLKEMVIFHELGHCVLFRGHNEATHANGTCASIMRSGIEGCRDNYREATRKTYLDELFAFTL
ncbi:MAG: hypothetical protein ACI8YQ_003015 [Polaribacter sp.]|jgi:hypothetical protein